MDEICSYCGDACEGKTDDPFAWDAGQPYCSEECFEAAEQLKNDE